MIRVNLAKTLLRLGAYEEGCHQLTRARSLDPASAPIAFADTLALPVIYDSIDQVEVARMRFEEKLAELEAGAAAGGAADAGSAADDAIAQLGAALEDRLGAALAEEVKAVEEHVQAALSREVAELDRGSVAQVGWPPHAAANFARRLAAMMEAQRQP